MCGEDADVRYEDTMYYSKVEAVKEISESLFKATVNTGRLRMCLLKILFPGIVNIMNVAREKVFWADW